MERDTDTMIEPGERVHATYLMETALPLREAAEAMAGEQSTGTFLRVAGETAELRQAHAARVEGIEELEPAATPSLPGANFPTGVNRPIWHRAQVRLSWPVSNFRASLPNILATVAGNLFELGQFSGPPHRPALPAELRRSLSRTRLRGRGNASHGRRRARTAGRHDR
jgi:ribulose 1,5-bisphosphate carboxylase large subunit-like protein